MPAAIPVAMVASSVIGGLISKSGAKGASKAQQEGQQKVVDTTNQAVSTGSNALYDGSEQARGTLEDTLKSILGQYQPFTANTSDNLNSLQQLASASGPLGQQFQFNPSDLQNDPGYQFTLQQGQQALQRSAAAKGGLFSSGTLKSLAGYTTGTANQYFNDAYSRAANTFNVNRQSALDRVGTLQDLAKMSYGATSAGADATRDVGSTSANIQYGTGQSIANLGMRGADTIARAYGAQGNAQAAGDVGAANAWNGTISNGSKAINDYLINKYPPGGSGSMSTGSGGTAY